MPSEFDLIRRHFTRPTRHSDLGVGDDAALLRPRPGMQLALSTDMLVAGTHFFADADPAALGWKALAVNVSDLAAMGAEPRWALLGLALPEADEAWIGAFASGFFDCAARYGVDLAGGDTTRGPLAISVTIAGEVPDGQAVTRGGAKPGNEVWISGYPGLAALGLAQLRGEIALADDGLRARCLDALHRPRPRVELGLALRGLASAMLDVSDGLLGDLGHILECSGVGAIISPDALALPGGVDATLARRCQLAGGDDYELLFTAAPARRAAIEAVGNRLALPLARIGCITASCGELLLRAPDGGLSSPALSGYDHFG